jgi:hypothetical protein
MEKVLYIKKENNIVEILKMIYLMENFILKEITGKVMMEIGN